MKNSTIVAVLCLLFGVVIGYWLGNRQTNLILDNDLDFKINKNQLFNFNFTNLSEEPRHTDTISYEKANELTIAFKNRLKSSISIPGMKSKIIAWPDSLHGWILDAKKVKEILIDGNGGTNICQNIFVELGYNKKSKATTLIFTGVNNFFDESSKKTIEKKIYRKTDNKIWQTIIPHLPNNSRYNLTDNILEYVDPCKPRCPD